MMSTSKPIVVTRRESPACCARDRAAARRSVCPSRPAPRPRRRTAGLSMPSSVLREVVVGPARHPPWWDYRRVDRRFPRDLPAPVPACSASGARTWARTPGRWCRPSICSIWWNARFEDLSRTFGLSGPQTRQLVLGDGQGVGAYSKSKLLLLVRYCYTK